MSVLSVAILVVVRQGSGGLSGCPVAVTVYPPGRGCLHSATLAQESPAASCIPPRNGQLVRPFFFLGTSPPLLYLPTVKQPCSATRTAAQVIRWWLSCFSVDGEGCFLSAVGRLWRHVCLNHPPLPSPFQRKPFRGGIHGGVSCLRACRGEVEMAACCRRGHFAAEWPLPRSWTTFITFSFFFWFFYVITGIYIRSLECVAD